MSFACEAVSAEVYQMSESVCVICCEETAETLVATRTKGFQSLLHASETRGCESLSHYLRSGPPEVLIHNSCRKRFTDLRHVFDVGSEHLNPKKLRSTKGVFDWKSACFLCMSSSVKRTEIVHKVETLQIQSTFSHYCDIRNDVWGMEVKGRIATCNDLCAEEIWYHRNCYMRFVRTRHVTEPAEICFCHNRTLGMINRTFVSKEC